MLGNKQFELSNLPIAIGIGNVLTTVSDRKLPHTSDNITIDYYTSDITSAQDYYAFGQLMPGRNWSSDSYKFGFNGQEKDDEIAGVTGSYLAFEYRIYNSRTGRFLSVDPLYREYPWNSTYAFAENDVIRCIDIEGAEKFYRNNAEITSTEDISNPHAGDIFVAENNKFQLSYYVDKESGASEWISYFALNSNNDKIVIKADKPKFDLDISKSKSSILEKAVDVYGIYDDATCGNIKSYSISGACFDLAQLTYQVSQNETPDLPIAGTVMKQQQEDQAGWGLVVGFKKGYASYSNQVDLYNKENENQIYGFYMTENEFSSFVNNGSINTNNLSMQGSTGGFYGSYIPTDENGNAYSVFVTIMEADINSNGDMDYSNTSSVPIK